MALVGKVVGMTGEAFVILANGTRRALHLGDQLHTGDIIQTSEGANIDVELVTGRVLHIKPEQQMGLTGAITDTTQPSESDSAVNLATIDTVIQALESGKDINDVLEETAAGQVAQQNNSGSTFVELLRVEDVQQSLNLTFSNNFDERLTLESAVNTTTVAQEVAGAVFFAPPVANALAIGNLEGFGVVSRNLIAVDANGDALTYSLTDTAPAGLTLNPDGSFTFDYSDPAYDGLAVGVSQVMVVPYQVVNSNGGISTSTLTITVTGTNDAATVSSADVALTETNVALTTSGTLTSTDVDNANNSFTANTIVGTTGTFAIDGAGAWTFTANSAFDNLNVGQNVNETFAVTSIDGTASAVKITINGTNDAAVISGTSTGSITESNAVQTATGTLTSTDVDGTANLFTVLTSTAGTNNYGHFTMTTGGAWTYTMDTAHNEFVAGTDYTDSVTVTAADGTQQVITVTMTGTNDAPIITSNGAGTNATMSLSENATPVTTVVATDPDVGAVLTYSIVGGADTARFTINSSTGVLSFLSAPDFEAPTDIGANNVYDVIVRVSDGILFDDQAIAVTVTDVVGEPVTGADNVITNVAIGTSFDIPVWALLQNDTLAPTGITNISAGTGGTTSAAIPGFVTFNDNTPANGSFIYQAVNALGAGTLATVTITSVSGTNIAGTGGADIIIGDSTNDTITGFVGADLVDGGGGTDTIVLTATAAALNTATDAQITSIEAISAATAAAGVAITLTNQTEGFSITGSGFADTITGGAGADTMMGGVGADTLDGGAGNDRFVYTTAATLFTSNVLVDSITGGTGTDDAIVVNASAAFTIATTNSFATRISGIESIKTAGATASAISITLNDNAYEAGIRTVDLSADINATGTNIINVGAETGVANSYNLTGSTGVDNITGGAGADTLTGGAGNDTLTGGTGTGSDTFNVDAGTDTITDLATGDILVVSAGATATTSNNVSAFTATAATANAGTVTLNALAAGSVIDMTSAGGVNGYNLVGGAGVDTLTGSGFADTLIGGAGADTLTGGGGNDTLTGGLGVDTFVLNGDVLAETDTIADWGNGVDVLSGTLGVGDQLNVTMSGTSFTAATIAATAGVVNVTGSAVADSITGGAGDDTLTGGLGADTLVGGAGNDTFNLANGQFLAGESIDGGTGTGDTIVLTNATTVDFTIGTITGIEALTAGVGLDTVTLSATQWAGFSTINLGGTATNILNVVASGDISALTLPTVTATTLTGNLTGTVGTDTVTLTGAQLDAIIQGAGIINLGNGAGDTINLTSTSADLNTLGATNTSILGVEAISATTAVASVSINLSAQTEAFTITGSGFADTLTGGTGADTLTGGAGNDTLTGGAGNDIFVLNGDVLAETDTITGWGNGTDVLSGTLGTGDQLNVTMSGTSFTAAIIAATNGVVNVTGSAGNDTITGGVGNDTISAGLGNDTINGFVGADTLTGGGGTDTIVLTATSADLNAATDVQIATVEAISAATALAGVAVTLINQSEGFSITGSGFADTLTGGTGADTLTGGAGNDTLTGGAGNDTFVLNGDVLAETDTITDWGNGTDVLSGTLGTGDQLNVTMSGTSFTAATIAATNGVVNVTGSAVADTITGGAGADTLTGGAGNDTISGGAGNDTLAGGAGNDTITGFVGADMVDGGTNTDTIVLTATAAALNVSADSQIVNVEAISAATALAGVSINLSAQTEAFTITGGTSADTLTGGAGNDALIGGAGTDTLTGGAGADTFNVDAGTDSITDLATGDNLVVSAGATAIANVSTFTATASTTNAGTATLNALAAGSTIDMRLADGVNGFNLVGGAGVDTLTGSVNADTISGGAGVDAINMGAGNNVAVVNAVVGTSSNSGRVTVANNANDTGQDTITGFNLANDTLKIAATNVINFVHAADTAVGTAGATDTGVASSFTALTGLVELNQTTNNNWSDAGDVAVTFVSPIGTFNLTSFQARLQYNLTGTSANNTIATGVLDDTITGGAGSDTLTGGAGADSFVFNAVVGTSSNSINLVKDTVTDFVTGIDTVLIRATNVNNFSVSTDVGATAGGSGIYSADLNHNGTLTDLGDVQFISTVAIATNLAAQNATRVDLIGTTGADTLSGGINSDTLAGGSGADTLTGGAGADTLTGGLGADTFVWKLGDGGSIGIPVTDAITDFNVASVALGGDVLDLRDLLVSENTGILANYLHFEYTGGNTIVHVSSTGQFSPTFSQANDVQTITLTGVNLVQSFADDNAIIQDLLTKQKLITD